MKSVVSLVEPVVFAMMLFVLFLFSNLVWAGSDEKVDDIQNINIDMFVGEVKVLGIHDDIERVAIGSGKVVRLEVKDSGEMILIAEDKGSSSLRIWKKGDVQLSYNIRVSERDPETRVRMETMVRMNVKIVEVRKNALKNIGLDWIKPSDGVSDGPVFSTAGDFISNNLFRSEMPAIEGEFPLSVSPFSTHFGIATSIRSQINYLASNGDAITLAEPNLSCVNGGSAEFLAGGEVPYPVIGANGQTTVEFKSYGIKLNIKPRVDTAGNIYTNIMTEVSQIDPAVSVLGAPGLLSRRTKTQMNVVTGQTIVISGLLSAENSEDVNKFPFLGDIPILGKLFTSTRYRNQLTELVVFVTPEVVHPQTASLREREQNIYDYSAKKRNAIIKTLDFNLMD